MAADRHQKIEERKTRTKDHLFAPPNETPPSTGLEESTFRSFIENLPVMFYAVTPTPPHTPIYISPTFEKFGYPLDDWLTKPDIWDRVIHPDDRKSVLDTTRDAMRKGESVDFEYRVVCKDGTILWVRDRSCFIKEKNGEPLCWQGVVLDITERKLAEQELEKREKLYRTLARTIPRTAVLLFDHDFRYTLADGEQLRNHTWSQEMFEGRTLYEVFPPEISDEWSGYYKRALAGEDISVEMDNAEGAFQISVLPVRDETGGIFAGMVMWQDITERKRAEDTIKESEARYRQLFETANDIIYVHDLEGNFISINQAAERIFGYTREEALAMNMTSITAPEHVSLVKKQLSKKLNGNASQTVYEVDCLKSDGSRATLEVNSSVITKDGQPIAIQGIARDITERKAAEQALRESEAQFRTLAETASDAIITIDDSGIISFINAGAEKMFGYTEEEMLGNNITMLMPEEMRPRHNVGFSRFLETGKRNITWKSVELPGMRKDGRKIQLDLSFAEYNKAGRRCFTSVIRDITERKDAEEAMRKNEERYRDLFENANDLIYTHDLNGNFTSLNRAGEVITGYPREEALRMNIAQVVAPEFLEFARTMTARKVVDERPTTYELEIISKQGNRVTLELSTRLIVSSDGMPVGVQGVARDITDRRHAEDSLHRTISLFASTFESTADGIVVLDLNKKIVTCNQKFIEMWDADPALIESKDGKRLIDFVADQLKDPDAFLTNIEKVYVDPHAVASEILELKDGRLLERYSQPQFMEDKPVGRVACFRDITERNRAEERLRHSALHDALTNLPNRIEFMNQLKQAVERADGNSYAKFAVLFLDLDRFKVVNDSLGHAVGDKLLIAISERLTACVRPGDVVARLGGDEFTILLNRSGDSDEVAHVAERLQAKISEPFKIDNYEVFTTASIGIVVSGNVLRTAEDFLRDADAAMYRAKESGKARYEIFDREMHVRNMNLLQVETDLRHAVERGQFEVLYQPIVDLTTGSVDEFEALIRWRHPVHGLVNPNEFINVAEETGLIIPIGKWILEESCRQVREWQRRFRLPLSVSVNLSAKQLMHPNLTAQVKDILLDTGLDSTQLKLEVTESTVMEHSDKSLNVLSELDQLGVALSTDDFGTGYSSLSYLQKFPFERLKIDRSFINIMDEDKKSGAIVKTILMLGENLDIEVVAEGIETASQLEKLRSLGCVKGQGYLFSRPIDREAAEAFLESGANVFDNNPSLEFRNPGPVIEVADVQ
jgi:diguanylate cyclase (GGDEF)-like protein/PAS domain S-box-containing protein